MSLKVWKVRPLNRLPNRKLLAPSWGSFGLKLKFPFTLSMVCPICCLIISIVLDSTLFPDTSETKKVSFAFPHFVVVISALLMHKPFSRKTLVMSDNSPNRSSVLSSNTSPCNRKNGSKENLKKNKNGFKFNKLILYVRLKLILFVHHYYIWTKKFNYM